MREDFSQFSGFKSSSTFVRDFRSIAGIEERARWLLAIAQRLPSPHASAILKQQACELMAAALSQKIRDYED